jgi:microcystin-dependent protein
MDINLKIKLTIDDRIIRLLKRIGSLNSVIIILIIATALASALLYAATKPHTFTPGATISSSQVNENFDAAFDAVAKAVPVGTVFAYAGTSVPEGFLRCDGSSISRITYTKLFEAIGITYGSGDGSTTFNLPDYRGVFLRGHHFGSDRDPDFASRQFGSWQNESLKSHDHKTCNTEIPGTGGTLGTDNSLFSGGGMGSFGTGGNMRTGWTGDSETRPKNISVNYIIKY